MRAIGPGTGAPETSLEFSTKLPPVPVVLYEDPAYPDVTTVVSRWQPTAEERKAIAAGEDIYVYTFSKTQYINNFTVSVGIDAVFQVDGELEFDEDILQTRPETYPTDSEGPE